MSEAVVPYREERELVIRLHLAAEFDDAYEGDSDGYEWYGDFERNHRDAALRALLVALTKHGRFSVTPINRGLDPREELELQVQWIGP